MKTIYDGITFRTGYLGLGRILVQITSRGHLICWKGWVMKHTVHDVSLAKSEVTIDRFNPLPVIYNTSLSIRLNDMRVFSLRRVKAKAPNLKMLLEEAQVEANKYLAQPTVITTLD